MANLSGENVVGDGTVSVSDYAGQGGRAELLGVLVRAVPGRGPAPGAGGDRARAGRVQFLGINVKDTKSAAADFLASKQVGYPSIYDPSMRTLLAIKGYRASGIPSTIVLDRQGRVAHIWLQAIDDPQQMIDVVGAIAAEQS